jgi:hypothetical protein
MLSHVKKIGFKLGNIKDGVKYKKLLNTYYCSIFKVSDFIINLIEGQKSRIVYWLSGYNNLMILNELLFH